MMPSAVSWNKQETALEMAGISGYVCFKLEGKTVKGVLVKLETMLLLAQYKLLMRYCRTAFRL